MIELSNISTRAPEYFEKKSTVEITKNISKKIAEKLAIMHAQAKYSLLVVFQGMDCSGKNGASREVFKYCSPILVNAVSFKKPTEEEFAHDFLWRIHNHAPAKGKITLFNRSHYEDVLIQRVHRWIDNSQVDMRINAINQWEKLLNEDNNTTILKFYLHLSKDRQEEKLMERIVEPRKQFKHNDSDWQERKYWDDYMQAYQDVINRSNIPWIIAPVDQRWYRNYFIAKKILDVLENMKLFYPAIKTNNEQWKK